MTLHRDKKIFFTETNTRSERDTIRILQALLSTCNKTNLRTIKWQTHANIGAYARDAHERRKL